jgi:O-acetyl-ADP-ribose deacetylase (regulator of RNase III)
MVIEIIHGDITKVVVDAIVNAANTSLMGGGGVDGAIHRAGGVEILEECRKIVARQGGCKPGEAVITSAGRLPSKFVIHTVGPVWQGGSHDEAKILTCCYTNALRLAAENHCRSIAFPNISTGIYGYPKDKAVDIATKAVREYLRSHPDVFQRIFFVCFDHENYSLMKSRLTSAAEAFHL